MHLYIYNTIPALLLLLAAVALNDAAVDDDFFVESILTEFGDGTGLTATQLDNLLESYRSRLDTDLTCSHGNTANQDCASAHNVTECLESRCMDGAAIFVFHSLSANATLNAAQLQTISPTVLVQIDRSGCHCDAMHEIGHGPSTAEVWGYGFLMVTIINVCTVLGYCFLPLMDKPVYDHLLMFMVALAVGALCGNGILVLIPETLELHLAEGELAEVYIWRMLAVVGGVYLFFIVERFLKLASCCGGAAEYEDEVTMGNGAARPSVTPSAGNEPSQERNASINELVVNVVSKPGDDAGQVHAKKTGLAFTPTKDIKSVAWMIIFGDALHNFIDGLTIGAAFSESTLAGFSVSIAIFCEELPHELGDFAILLNAGMTIKQAVLFNLGSGMSCYLGLVIGVAIGELTEGGSWIFALAAGMFLYISLVDMVPEMNEKAVKEAKKGYVFRPLLIQNGGLLLGFAIIFTLSYFGEYISFE